MTEPDEALLKYFRGRPCDWPGCRRPPPNDPHHVMGRGHNGAYLVERAIALCTACREHHDLHGDDPRCLHIWLGTIARREGLESWEVVRDAIYRLRRESPKDRSLDDDPDWLFFAQD
jgi:hypothetical protein